MMIQYYVINRLVRSVSAPLDKDRFLSPDIDAVTKLLQDEKVSDYTLIGYNKYGLDYLIGHFDE